MDGQVDGADQRVIAAASSYPSAPATWREPCEVLAGVAGAGFSPLATYAQSFASELHREEHSALVALAALLVGACCLYDGPALWRTIFTVAASASAAYVAHLEAQVWAPAQGLAAEVILVVQVAFVAALAVHFGFEGSQVLWGSVLGFLAAYALAGWVRGTSGGGADFLVSLWYEVGAVSGLLLFTAFRRPTLSALAPLFGGLLAASGCAVLLATFAAPLAGPLTGVAWWPLPAREATWPVATAALLGAEVNATATSGDDAAAVVIDVAAVARALAANCGCGLLCLVLHAIGSKRVAVVGCLIGGALLQPLSILLGLVCVAVTSAGECPESLQPPLKWGWPVCGGTLWALLAFVAAWFQFGILERSDQEGGDAWRQLTRRFLPASRADSRQMGPRYAALPAGSPTGASPSNASPASLLPSAADATVPPASPDAEDGRRFLPTWPSGVANDGRSFGKATLLTTLPSGLDSSAPGGDPGGVAPACRTRPPTESENGQPVSRLEDDSGGFWSFVSRRVLKLQPR
eukprot:TRINITY_DN20394_c0_g2_i1.p1 TRINITY_DN20394_c0_g2~~TRINITY_DN20394_c0_g2_i1.p1  ORF type:complete len:521 (-),score=70.52 TRINITY_DN20394_c0_g2_i1:83-1645(-)